MTAGTITRPATGRVVEDLDPRTLLVDLNIRDHKPDKALIDSIAELGVIQPVIAVRTPEGQVRVRHGHRRVLAAIEAGQTAVPVLVVGEGVDGDDAAVARILSQYDENTRREGLNAAEQAGVVVQLLELGIPAGQVQKRTRLPKDAIAAAQAVHGSAAASKAAAARPELTLDQAAAVAEFETDENAIAKITEAAAEGDGTFRHQLERLRHDRAGAEASDALTAKLQGQGITVLDESPGWDKYLDSLYDDKGKRLTSRGHKKCPGHAAKIYVRWTAAGPVAEATYYCLDPKANGHKKSSDTGSSGDDLERQREERRIKIAGNKEWRAAQTVRREWLSTFIARKDAPKDAARFIIESLARCDNAISYSWQRYWAGPRKLLGVPEPAEGTWGTAKMAGLLDTIGKASDSRALMIGLGLVLGAYEDTTDVNTWRPAGPSTTRTGVPDGSASRYFTALASWGYTLAPIEQSVADGAAYTPQDLKPKDEADGGDTMHDGEADSD